MIIPNEMIVTYIGIGLTMSIWAFVSIDPDKEEIHFSIFFFILVFLFWPVFLIAYIFIDNEN